MLETDSECHKVIYSLQTKMEYFKYTYFQCKTHATLSFLLFVLAERAEIMLM